MEHCLQVRAERDGMGHEVGPSRRHGAREAPAAAVADDRHSAARPRVKGGDAPLHALARPLRAVGVQDKVADRWALPNSPQPTGERAERVVAASETRREDPRCARRTRIGIPLSTMAALVGYARIHTGVHYPIEVIAGRPSQIAPAARADAFAERAPRALRATGEPTRRRLARPVRTSLPRRRRSPGSRATALQPADRLALYISPVFAKLGIGSRAQLRAVLPERRPDAA